MSPKLPRVPVVGAAPLQTAPPARLTRPSELRERALPVGRGRLARFSLEALLRFLARAGMHVELHVTRTPRPQRTRDQSQH